MDDARSVRIQLWSTVRKVFRAADELRNEADRLRAEAKLAGSPPVLARGKLAAPPGAPAGYLSDRTALRELIRNQLEPALTRQLGTQQTQLCMVAIVSWIDERERKALGAQADAWQLTLHQTELLGINDGGDLTFTQIEELRERAHVDDLVFEIHLLCLRAGLEGRYADRPHEIHRITRWLVDQLRRHPRRAVSAPEASPPTGERIGFAELPPSRVVAVADPPLTRGRIGFVQFPVRYYVGVAAVVAAVFLGLRIVSSREVARSNLASDCHYRDEGAP